MLVYDGDCGFCRRWIARWGAVTGDRVIYVPFQESVAEFPGIPVETFRRSVVLVEPDGCVTVAARAVLRALAVAPGRRWPLRLYEHSALFAAVAEAAYRFIAEHRGPAARFTSLLWGAHLEPPTFSAGREFFLRTLGAVYIFAFASLLGQVNGLIGSEGIFPAGQYLAAALRQLGHEAWFRLPTIFWLGAGDTMLQAVAITGALLALLLVAGVLPAVITALLWFLYLSLMTVGGPFLSFQWDALLLEAGFLAIFLSPRGWAPLRRSAPPSRLIVFLFQWLVFRLHVASGAVKILSGDPSWRSLRALEYHYETQPLPTVIGWYAHQAPAIVQHVSTFAVLATELVVPFLLFCPRRLRHLGAAILIAFQVLIALTGNYAFFNLLTIALLVLLFDDAAFGHGALTRRFRPPARPAVRTGLVVRTTAALLLLLSLLHWIGQFMGWRIIPAPGRAFAATLAPFQVVNDYGLFAVMTTSRPEVVIEGSDDGITWREYGFRWKPGDVARAPRWAAPHQPRLDWQMWFAALDRYERVPWFRSFLGRLLEGSPSVLGLLGGNPFPDRPPRLIRAVRYDYQFTDLHSHRRTGLWWRREETGIYAQPFARGRLPVKMGAP